MADNAGLSAALDGIPMVADAAAREARFPLVTRKQNQRVFRLDTGEVQRWAASSWISDPISGPIYDNGGAVFNVKHPDFGAKGDGVTDDTAAIQAALTAAQAGGVVFFPAGWYKVTDQLTVSAATTIHGAASADFTQGSPPLYAHRPAFIVQATAGKAIFVLSGSAGSRVTFRNISLSRTLTPTSSSASADGSVGVLLQGSYPNFAWTTVFENVTFHDLHYGIKCTDPHAGTAAAPYNYDWSVSPVSIRDCQFYYPLVGVYINSNNADNWIFDRAGFFIPVNGDGVWAYRSGLLHFRDSGGGGAAATNNRFLRITGNGGATSDGFGVDKITLEQCQVETLAHFIKLEAGGTWTIPFIIHLKDCINQMGAEIYLGSPCHFIHEGCYFANSVRIDHVNVKISGASFQFDAGQNFAFLSGDPRTTFQTLFPGPDSGAGYANLTYQNGRVIGWTDAPPMAGTFHVQDVLWNTAPRVGAPIGWVCVTAGTPGTWTPIAWVPGVSANNGDASLVLTATSASTQRFDTALTTNRTVTLPANGASTNGQRFRIVRTGLGAFTLTVQDAASTVLKAMPSATAAFVDAQFNGTNWQLSGYGAL